MQKVPELPEVETVRRGLEELTLGFTLQSAEQLHPRALKADSILPLRNIAGAKINAIKRRGKFMWFELDRDFALVTHLGMSGQYLFRRPNSPLPRHIRAQFDLVKGRQSRTLYFNDQRTFGWVSVEELQGGIPTSVLDIALDPLDPQFDEERVIAQYLRRKASIKTLLLNQSIMSGVGNIYADESLWRARIHPEREAHSISKAKLSELINTSRDVFLEALKSGGTSFDSLYIHVNGESGFFETELNAYGQSGVPCPRCGTLIKRIAFANRSSHFCPKCQRK